MSIFNIKDGNFNIEKGALYDKGEKIAKKSHDFGLRYSYPPGSQKITSFELP